MKRTRREQPKVDEKLRKSEEHYQKFIELSEDGIAIVDEDGTIIEWNLGSEKIFGLKKEDAIGRKSWDIQFILTPKEKRNQQEYEAIKSNIIQLLKTGQVKYPDKVTESYIQRPDEICRFIQPVLFSIKTEKGYMLGSITRDITDQKSMELNLRSERNKLETITRHTGVYIAVISRDYKTIWANEVIRQVFGEVDGKYCFEVFGNGNNICSECGVKKVFEFGSDKYIYENYSKDRDGNIVWHQFIVTPIRDENGAIESALEVIVPITEIKQAEEALRKSEEEYRTLFESSDEAIISIDLNGSVISINPSAIKTLGYENPNEIIGKNISDFFLNIDIENFFREKTNRDSYIRNIGYELARKDGTIIYIQSSLVARYDDNGKIIRIYIFFRDITEKHQNELELMKMQKLESIGIFAGGIAHDINNILTPILGNISLARIYNDPDRIAERLIEAEKAALRAKSLTQQLLTFSQGGAPIKEATTITLLIKETAIFTLRGSKSKCVFSIPDSLWSVEVDTGQISQVITNIILNADQSMPDGGIIKLSAENTIINSDTIIPLSQGKYIKISVEDHGIGIPEKYINKIFDLYFTTKQKGSGLGLTVSYSIIRNHSGYITVDSKLEKGTTITVYIPAISETIPLKADSDKEPIKGKGKILVMDDDDMVNELVTVVLQTLGYSPILANDGKEAIRLYKDAQKSKEPFDAVILDLTVPGGVGGKETIQTLLEINPNIKAIVSSGYANDPIMSDYKKYGFMGIIAKPYKTLELSEVLNKVLSIAKS